MPLNRAQLSQLYRPIGPKKITTVAFTPGAAGSIVNLVQAVDLSLPIEGFRLVFKFRDIIGGADMTSVKPEGWLNLISQIKITGTNSRQRGNVTLWDIDLATLWVTQHMFQRKAASLNGYNATANNEYDDPSTPFGPMMIVTQGTYDVRIVVDLPAYPFGTPELARGGFLFRQSEWKDSLQLQISQGLVTTAGGGTDALGVEAANTTHTFSAYGGGGSPTVDVYSLPNIMGLDLKDAVTPGFMSRVTQPLTTILQSAASNVNILTLQKQPTSRIFFKIGTSTVAPAFTTLSDTNVTALGVSLGGNRVVRELDDVFSHKQSFTRQRATRPIQGYNCFDFLQSGNPDSAYPGDALGDGTTFQLIANIVGVANALGLVIQEQELYRPEGPLYSF